VQGWTSCQLLPDAAVRGLAAQTLLISMPRLAPLPVDVWLRHRAAVLEALGSDLPTATVPEILAAQEAARPGLRPFPYVPAESQHAPADLVRYAASAQRIHTGALLVVTTAEESAAFLQAASKQLFRRRRGGIP
jgi:para-nitrobenzyl esterase